MKYILASDFDGTLKCGPKVSEENLAAIKEFREQGHLFGVVTGRGFLDDYREHLDYIVACNGATAYDKNGELLFSVTTNGSRLWKNSTLAQELIKRLLELTASPCGMCISKEIGYVFHPECPRGGVVNGIKYSPLSVLETVGEFNMANAICDNDFEAAETVAILQDEFGEVLNPLQNDRCIDIPPFGVNKANGIARLAECLNIPKDSIFTVGDNFNDMSMVESYHGCAMSHGVGPLKEAAEYVCDSVADFIKVILSK